MAPEPALPQRAQNIAHARGTKTRAHHHDHHYLLLKAHGDDIHWHEARRGVGLPLSQHSRDFGAASLLIEPADEWSTTTELWLVENQALFDQTDWLPPGTRASILYYGGQLNRRLLDWLARGQRASRIVHFAAQMVSNQGTRALKCLHRKFNGETQETNPSVVSQNIVAMTFNTKDRLKAYMRYNTLLSGSVLSLPEGDTCDE